MTSTYHVSPDGKARVCSANKATCKFGAGRHITQAQYENLQKSQITSAEDVFVQADAALRRRANSNAKQTSYRSSEFEDVDYNSWPVPQASDLDKIGAVVDSVFHQADTSDSIGEAIGVGDRNGSYYANAAGYLGLVDKFKDYDGGTHYSLTSAGQMYSNLSAEGRTVMLSQLVERTPLTQSYREGFTETQIKSDITESGEGYSDAVADRRYSTLKTWVETVDNNSDLAEKISQQQKSTIMRSVEAAMKQRQAEQERKAATLSQRRGEMCMTCFTEKSLTNQCLC